MSAKITISILGRPSKAAYELLQKLAKNNYRLLFIENENDSTKNIVASLENDITDADIELVHCSVEGCWEADVIFLLSVTDDFKTLARQIKNVSTGKLVVLFNEGLADAEINLMLTQSLPFCKIVSIFWSEANVDHGNDFSSLGKWVISGDSYEGKISLHQILENVNAEAVINGENVNENLIDFNNQIINF